MTRYIQKLYWPETNSYSMDHLDVDSDLLGALRYCFDHHYENNPIYKYFSINIDACPKYQAIDTIAVLPNIFFFQSLQSQNNSDIEHILSLPSSSIIFRINVPVSDQTLGNFRVYPFDADSMNLSLIGMSKCFRSIYDLSPEDYFYFLSPNNKGATNIDKAMKKVLSVVVGYENTNCRIIHAVQNSEEKVNAFKVVDDIQQLMKKTSKIHIYGSLNSFMLLSDEIIQNGINLDLPKGTLALLSEGQDSINQNKIEIKRIKEKIELAFGIPSQNQRMNHGVMEVMQIFPQCEAGFFHIPLGVIVSIRNRDDYYLLGEVHDGEEGQICVINPMIWSFPPFIATEATGRIVTPNKMKCACGKYGPTFSIGEKKGLPSFCCLEQEVCNTPLAFVIEDTYEKKSLSH